MNPSVDLPNDDHVEADITRIVAITVGKNRRPFGVDDSILSIRGNFESYALLELILRLEDAFGIQIGDDELDPDYFESIGTISTFVRSKLNGKQ